jgi:hypothetical protein
VNAQEVAVDSDGGVYVSDPSASELLYVPADCQSPVVVIPQNHYIASPYGVEILNGRGVLIVSSTGRPGIYFVEVNAQHELIRYANTGATSLFAYGLAECVDNSGNNGFFFVEQSQRLVFFDIVTNQRTVILDFVNGIVDIGDIEYRDCGIFFTANDNNQVWRCSVGTDFGFVNPCIMSSSSCYKLCDKHTDASSCDNLMSPNGLAVGQYSNIFLFFFAHCV